MLFPALATIAALAALAFWLGRGRALAVSLAEGRLRARPNYYGGYVALWAALPALAATIAAALFAPAARGALLAALLAAGLAGAFFARRRVTAALNARVPVERATRIALGASSLVAILTTVGIIASLLFEAWRFFERVPMSEFLFGLQWSPQTAIREDQVGSSGAFGAVPVFAGTLLITLIAMSVAAPIGLLSAIYLAEYARPRVRALVKPLLEVLAGIPTVVYGFFAALTVAPAVRGFGERIGLDIASESALAAGGVMGVMIIPFVSSLSDDVIRAVPQSLREASLGLGATPSETIRRVVFPAALPGIVGALLLAVSRAVGETMIVVMAAGLAANLTANPLEAVTTVTVQIVTLLVGDQEFDSAKTLAAFALGLALFLVTLVLNVIALEVVRRYREQYE
ncbi:MAG: phosphate ABC transporter permease subunit PstC [Deltaproteobacteria bacterium]|nr:phosphate ABC transporter permease subunit PstC [Deltaproteobacteria bacterium]